MKPRSTVASWAATMLAASWVCAHAVTADDYARAERLLPFNTASLVHNVPKDVAWQEDGSVRYAIQTSQGEQAVSVNPADHSRVLSSPVPEPAATDPAMAPSPDGRYVAFIRNDNLWVRESGSGVEAALT